MRTLVFLAAAIGATGCFDPTFKADLGCGPDGECPSGLTCGPDNICRGAGGEDAAVADARADARELPDAQPDAMTVACTSNADCQVPPNPCLLAGTCNASNECDFPAVDCSGMTDECNDGICDTDDGSCIKVPAREGNDCNGGTACGAFGPCGGFTGGTCDSSGTQTRDCTSNTCQIGACVPEEFQEMAACTRVTEGDSCGTMTVTGCPPTCTGGFSGTCDESGSYTCTCTTFTCQSDVCTSNPTSCSQPCNRPSTDGVTCSPDTVTNCGACNYSNACDESATRTCTCNSFACQNEVCTTSSSSCNQSCSRDTDGDMCSCAICGTAGELLRPLCCSAGSCGTSCGTCGSC